MDKMALAVGMLVACDTLFPQETVTYEIKSLPDLPDFYPNLVESQGKFYSKFINKGKNVCKRKH